MSLLLLFPSAAGPLNLTSAGGTATAAGGTTALTVQYTATTGTATAAGTTPVLTVQYTAAAGGATAAGGQVFTGQGLNLTATAGTATAGGGTSTLTVRIASTGGTATAGGGSSSVLGFIPSPAGKFVLRNARIVVAGIDVSALTHHVDVKFSREEIDVTPITGTHKEFVAGPTTGEFTISLFYDTTVLTPVFWSTLDSPVLVQITPRNTPTAPDNPTWQATATAVKRTTLDAEAGEAAKAGLELRAASEALELAS